MFRSLFLWGRRREEEKEKGVGVSKRKREPSLGGLSLVPFLSFLLAFFAKFIAKPPNVFEDKCVRN